jgi:hypothetical protein
MATQVQFRRGTTTQNNAFTGALAEITYDTEAKTLRLHDGTTSGGGAVVVNTAGAQTLTNKTLSTNSVWQGTAIGLANGGTNSNLTAVAGAVAYSTASAVALSAAGTSGQVLTSGGTSAPTWTAQSSLTVGTATTATTATNIAGGSAGNLVIQLDTNQTTFVAAGADGTFLKSTGASTAPVFVAGEITIGSTATPFGGTSTSLAGLNILAATGTSHWTLPAGTVAQRPASPANGMVRYNTDQSSFEGYASGAWSSLGGVKSVDGFTFIQAETSAAASNGDLDFYAENTAGTGTIQVGQWNRTNLKDFTGTLVGTQTTQNVFNATATTVNAFGAATTLTIGATTGTATLRNSTVAITNNATVGGTLAVTGNQTNTGDLALNGGDLTTTSTTATLFNTNATTLNVGQAATTISIGATSGTTTVRNSLVVTGDLTINGTTTTINATTLTVDDKNIELGSVASPTDTTADGGGITLKGTTDKTITWSTIGWTSSEDFNLVTGKQYEINGTAVLTATALGSGVVGSSLTSVGTIATGTWQGTIISPTYGGTGINNGTRTITLGGNFTHTGAHTLGLTTTANTSVTLPTTGTLATLAGTETFTNKTLTSPTLTTPVLGTPSSGTLTNCTGLPVSGITASTTTAIGVGSIELGHATDTTIARSAAGVVTIEGVEIVTLSRTQTLTNKTLTSPTFTTPTLGTPASGTLTNCTGLPNAGLVNSAVTIGSTSVSLGATVTTFAGLSSVTSTTFVGALTGNASTATTLQTARTIGGVSFNGSANIDLPGVNTAGNQNTTGSAATLTTPRAIQGVNFNGSAAITVLTAGTGITVSGTQVSIPQAVGTASNVQFGSFGVGTAASGTSGEIRATNQITSFFSDDRLKTRTGNIQNALEKVLSLDGFHYYANETAVALGYDASKQEVGLSAQQVQAVLPEVIAPAPIDPQYMTMHYERLVPLLVEAIKEQQKQIEELKAKLGN